MSSKRFGKKRELLRELFGNLKGAKEQSDASSANSSAGAQGASANTTVQSVSVVSPAPTPQSNDLLGNLYSEVLDKLGSGERLIIEKHAASSIDDAVQAAYLAAVKQKKVCEDKGWSASDKANKVLLWLDRFRSVGDIIANVDPVHVGLPWAGIRMLLEMTVADTRQMTALMAGMDIALCIANRLQAYVAYFQHLPTSLTADNLRMALVALYAHLLRFLAEAVETYSVSATARKFQALWQDSDLATFEDRCDKLGNRVEIEASNCDRELLAKGWYKEAQWKGKLDTILRQLDNIQLAKSSLVALQVKVDLSKLVRIHEATYNSIAEEKLSRCLDGTRSELLHDIMRWTEKLDGEFIFWLCGKAGTGKSTISRTVAQRLDEQRRLAASFFFRRGETNRSNADHFFSTITAQLADMLPPLQIPVAAALEEDSFLCGRGIQQQFEKLLLQPLLSTDTAHLPRHSIAIVIDALDECDRNTDIRVFLNLLIKLKAQTNLCLRVFLTSRPELPIQLGFRQLDKNSHQDIILEEVQEKTIDRDIRAYFDSQFASIKADRLLLRPDDAFPLEWPSEDELRILVELAVPLFIFAATVCRFVSDSNPQRRLKVILEQRHSAGSSHLARTYLPILDQLLLERDEDERSEILQGFRKVVGPIILAANPLSVVSLTSILCIDSEVIRDTLQHLHSVLHIPSSLDSPVRLLHQSFRDFLIDEKRKDKDGFWIDSSMTHGRLAAHCLQRLLQPNVLRIDICGVGQPGIRRTELLAQQVAMQIPSDVAYACSHWPWHLVKSEEQLSDDSLVHRFLRKHFLHWLEALSWLNRLPTAITFIRDLLSAAKSQHCYELARFLTDAERFVLSNRLMINIAPLQVYHSALAFAPISSVVRHIFQAETSNAWSLLPIAPLSWGAERLQLEGHDHGARSVVYSPDNLLLASLSRYGSLRLWNAQTGEEKYWLETGHRLTKRREISFSTSGQLVGLVTVGGSEERVQLWNVETGEQVHDSGTSSIRSWTPKRRDFATAGHLVAVSLHGCRVQLLDVRTGERTHTLEGHFSAVTALAISQDSLNVALGSADGTVQLWNAVIGVRMHKSSGHKGRVAHMAFAPHGHVVASASEDTTVQLWNVRTGEQVRKLSGHQGSIIEIVFSHDGQMIVSASTSRTVQLWDIQTGECVLTLYEIEQNDNSTLPLIASSPIEHLIAVAIHSPTIQLWNTQKVGTTLSLKGHSKTVNALVFSPDGQLIASAASDETIRLWNVHKGKSERVLKSIGKRITVVAFSPDGQLVASDSQDDLIRIWHTQTGELMHTIKIPHEAIQAIIFQLDVMTVSLLLMSSPSQPVSLYAVQLGAIPTASFIFQIDREIEDTTAISLSPDHRTVATGSRNGCMRVWSVVEGEQITRYQAHNQAISEIVFSQDGQMVVTSHDHSVRLWNVHSWEHMIDFDGDEDDTDGGWPPLPIFAPNGKILAALTRKRIRLWDTRSGEEIQRLDADGGRVGTITFSPDSYVLAIALDWTVQLWNIQSIEQLLQLDGHTDDVLDIKFSPTGQELASASWDGTVRLWSLEHNSETRKPIDSDEQIAIVDISSNSEIAASASRGGTVWLWNTETGTKTHKLQDRDGEVTALAFAPSGETLASVSSLGGQIVRLWDVRTGMGIHRLQGSGKGHAALTFSPDGKRVALTSMFPTGMVTLWNTQTGKLMQKLRANGEQQLRSVNRDNSVVRFSPDGQLIATMSGDSTLRLWNIQTSELMQMLPARHFGKGNLCMTFRPDGLAVVIIFQRTLGDHHEVQLWNGQTGEHIQTLCAKIMEHEPVRYRTHRFRELFIDGEILHTFDGSFILEWTTTGFLKSPLGRTTGLELFGSWVRFQDHDLLYLPYDLRGECAKVRGKMLMVGQITGRVDFFRLR